ncbi:MAG: ABC-three component system middle component 6 [bacterium]
MIMPTKHINFSESLLGFGSYIINQLHTPKNIDELWDTYQNDFNNGSYPAKQNFENLIIALLYLYLIGVITEKDGKIKKCV